MLTSRLPVNFNPSQGGGEDNRPLVVGRREVGDG